MIAIVLIGAGALLLAMGLGALVAPAAREPTAEPHDEPWQCLPVLY